ncbi:hypothetical protein F0562_014482 [Nyssa sinensis]|uniref:Ferredoxin thioredoxin reductase alpha chain domain-containing protein n=1 Tax=Nyssa sinensis TaxID=561372 RepID=A0A5J4ZR72_9ASTE|nr:hypothetical protein F0562_014482 [Nyssa sinensis]
MTSPASVNHFSPSINASMMMNSHTSSSPTMMFSRNLHVSVVRIAPPSIPIGGTRGRIPTSPVRMSDSTTVVDDPSVASSSAGATSASLSTEEEDQAAAAADKIGARVRVKVPLKVYHVPRVPEIDLTGMEGVLKQYVGIWKATDHSKQLGGTVGQDSSICGGLSELNGLINLRGELRIEGLGRELDLSDGDGGMELQAFGNLTCLSLRCIPKLVSLPVGLRHVTTLESLTIESCDNFTTLPERIGNLTSLQELRISYRPNLASLPCNLTLPQRLSFYALGRNNGIPSSR